MKTDKYTQKEIEMLEVRVAEQELEILELRQKIAKTEKGALFKQALRILEEINERRGNYIRNETLRDINQLLSSL